MANASEMFVEINHGSDFLVLGVGSVVTVQSGSAAGTICVQQSLHISPWSLLSASWLLFPSALDVGYTVSMYVTP